MPDLLILLDCREEPITPFTYSAGSTTPKRQTKKYPAPRHLRRETEKLFNEFAFRSSSSFSQLLGYSSASTFGGSSGLIAALLRARAGWFAGEELIYSPGFYSSGVYLFGRAAKSANLCLAVWSSLGMEPPSPPSQLPGGLDHFSRLSSASIFTGSFSMGGTVPSSFRAASYPEANFFIWSCP